jgi:hypothetical protein
MLDEFPRSSSISCRRQKVNMTVAKDAPHARFCALAILAGSKVIERIAHHQRNIIHTKDGAKGVKELGKGSPLPLPPEFEYAGRDKGVGRPWKSR